ncbi:MULTISPECIES: hypothetical protein [Gammaproteobacteria]|jgi:hypothetical protein|uniref:Uncharacterized protein n=1 Tax=Xanthomonas boreopolis TaxID=86183 RepID=A0A919F8U4_9XANT|nr:hypothetical protein [Pseudomonas sp. Hp2]GHH54405.1 hypothetical protein GCM10009090_21140 [[Pseudomonas] boreopolis]
MVIGSTASPGGQAAPLAHARALAAAAKRGDEPVAKDEQGDGTSGLQAVHSIVAGALGLEDPTKARPEAEKNEYYTAGKWLAAAGTVGTILSVLA